MAANSRGKKEKLTKRLAVLSYKQKYMAKQRGYVLCLFAVATGTA